MLRVRILILLELGNCVRVSIASYTMFVLPWFVGIVYHKHYYRDAFCYKQNILHVVHLILVLVSGV